MAPNKQMHAAQFANYVRSQAGAVPMSASASHAASGLKKPKAAQEFERDFARLEELQNYHRVGLSMNQKKQSAEPVV